MRSLVLSLILTCICLPALAVQPQPQLSFSQLTRVEKSYYEQVFNYTMDTTKPNETYEWKSYRTSGAILVGEPYVANSGSTCRNYIERITIQNVTGEDEGVSCKRQGREGWCKLKAHNALTCAMEKPADFFNVSMPSLNGRLPEMSINAGGIPSGGGNVAAPDPSMPRGVDAPRAPDVSGAGYADTVTGAAGAAAGPVTRTLKSWFGENFGR